MAEELRRAAADDARGAAKADGVTMAQDRYLICTLARFERFTFLNLARTESGHQSKCGLLHHQSHVPQF